MSHVDSASPVTHVSLCAGYGGIDLGLSRAIPSLRTIAFSEIEAFACANLVSKMEAGLLDPAPIWTDLKTFPWSEFHGRVDILSGGYPCQPFSAAGKRLGAEDPRHLWPYISAGIALMRPGVCFFENVEGHISLGLSDVIEDLAGMGYRTTWCVASASECGAPHQRKRVFILAYDAHGEQRAWSLLRQNWQGATLLERCGSGRAEELADSQCAGLEGYYNGHASTVAAQHVGADAWAGGERGAWERCGELADSADNGFDGRLLDREAIEQTKRHAVAGGCPWPSRPGEQQFAWEPPRVVADSKKSGRLSERIAGDMDGEISPEGSRGHQLASTIADCGDAGAGEGSGLSNATHLRLEEQSECGQQHQADGSGPSNPSGVCPCETQEGRPVEHSSHWSNGEQPAEQQGRHSAGGSSEAGAMGNAASERPQERSSRSNHSSIQATECGGGSEGDRQAQPPLGRDADGLTHRLDDAVLHVSTDNRTDELRLLGNGVVPATAERAFRVLVSELMEATT